MIQIIGFAVLSIGTLAQTADECQQELSGASESYLTNCGLKSGNVIQRLCRLECKSSIDKLKYALLCPQNPTQDQRKAVQDFDKSILDLGRICNNKTDAAWNVTNIRNITRIRPTSTTSIVPLVTNAPETAQQQPSTLSGDLLVSNGYHSILFSMILNVLL